MGSPAGRVANERIRHMNIQEVIVIPCYNESGRLNPEVFCDFLDRNDRIAFLFVDDGSTDETWSLLRGIDHPNVFAMKLPANRGKAEAVRLGMLEAAGRTPAVERIGFWDADLSTDLEEILLFNARWKPDTLMVMGCRCARLGSDIERRLFRHLIGRFFATIVSIHLKLRVYDTQCGAKILSRQAVDRACGFPFASRWFFDVEILKRLQNHYGKDGVIARVEEIPLTCWKDVAGSKVNYFRCMLDLVKVLIS
jgi:glycosyltransferase involved in cell wall biosynthesis